MAISQTASGKSFEYALAYEFAARLGTTVSGSAYRVAKRYFDGLDDSQRQERANASGTAVEFILSNEPRLKPGLVARVVLQSDQAGIPGDVRDIVLETSRGDCIGISAKVRNTAIRNSRLSPRIDFARRWLGAECSDAYRQETAQVWDYLQPLEDQKTRWSCIEDKADRVYMPLQRAFIREVERQFARNAPEKAATLMRYMLGTHDYYKVYKHNSTMSIESFNMDATLSWGKQVPIPAALVRIAMKPGSKTTSLMVLDQGWQLSFRLHSAESLVKRSLKFDVQVIGQPPRLTRHEVHYR